jgi:carboxyl-terminal processing protease
MKQLRTAGTLLLCMAGAAHASEPIRMPATELETLLEAYALVKSQYVEPSDDKKLLGGAIGGMLASLDPHSRYLDKEDLAQLRKDRDGEYIGIGIRVEVDGGNIYVVAVAEDGPAALAGIEEGDAIVSIDGASISEMPSEEVTRRMRGLAGTSLAIGYQRAGTVRTATLTRSALKAQTVRMQSLPSGLAWIRVSEFEGKTAADLAAALKSINALGAPRGIVLDVRNDPGGLVSAAVGVAGAFLPQETVLFSSRGHMAGANATVTVNPRYYRGRDEPDALADLPAWTRSVPLTVLVNGASASSAELVAGALQDNGRAKVIGTQTFGKGSIQSVFALSEESAVKLTVARYFTPNGKEIQAHGITPDVVVSQGKGHGGSGGLMMREADLVHHLKATLPVSTQPSEATRTAVESTRIFGTGDDKALAAAVALLTPGESSGRGGILRQLALRLAPSRPTGQSL